jgi:hypothetical protein
MSDEEPATKEIGGTITVGGNEYVECPVCGLVHVHIEGVGVHQKDRRVDVGPESDVRVTPDDAEEQAEQLARGALHRPRGSRVEVAFWCENGHRFTLALAFHKGAVTSVFERGPDVPETEDGSADWPPELWRD